MLEPSSEQLFFCFYLFICAMLKIPSLTKSLRCCDIKCVSNNSDLQKVFALLWHWVIFKQCSLSHSVCVFDKGAIATIPSATMCLCYCALQQQQFILSQCVCVFDTVCNSNTSVIHTVFTLLSNINNWDCQTLFVLLWHWKIEQD